MKFNLTIDDVIRKVLVAIYSHDILKKSLFLKGGQALRFGYGIEDRFSADADFSMQDNISSESEDIFFNHLKTSIYNEFHNDGFYMIDFKNTKRPKMKIEGQPDFWQGWKVEFKIITKNMLILDQNRQSAQAIQPLGTNSNVIEIDISEKEYCGHIETIKLKTHEMKVYSITLLILEKIRAICQQHQNYVFRSENKTNRRARDLYDIERLYNKILTDIDVNIFFKDCRKHLRSVFDAKEVPLYLIMECFWDTDFIETLKDNWQEVENTITGSRQSFEYYLETTRDIVKSIS